MTKYMIEREIPGAGLLSAAELRDISRKSVDVLRSLGPDVQWVQSYVVADKLYEVYHARDEAIVREHARRGGFPVNRIAAVLAVLDPSTLEGS